MVSDLRCRRPIAESEMWSQNCAPEIDSTLLLAMGKDAFRQEQSEIGQPTMASNSSRMETSNAIVACWMLIRHSPAMPD